MRHMIRRMKSKGFTLVELMIVVAIVGILAVLAVYGVRKYIANAKTAEARNSLGQIGKDVATAFERERMDSTVLAAGGSTGSTRQICGEAAAKVPTSADAIKGQKYQSTKEDWSNATDVQSNKGFPCFHFSMDAPQYFQYNYSGTGSAAGDSFYASAQGDLNGDGTLSYFEIKGQINGSLLLNVAPALSELSPEE